MNRMRRPAVLSVVGGFALAAAWLVVQASAPAAEEPSTEGLRTIRRGAPIGKSPLVPLSAVFHNPGGYVGKTVQVRGVVKAVCQKKGCWMEIVAAPGERGVRVTFKDYGFFVPKDCAGMRARLEGTFELRTLDAETAEHLASEGASITRNPDGTATELGFVATGVVLQRGEAR